MEIRLKYIIRICIVLFLISSTITAFSQTARNSKDTTIPQFCPVNSTDVKVDGDSNYVVIINYAVQLYLYNDLVDDYISSNPERKIQKYYRPRSYPKSRILQEMQDSTLMLYDLFGRKYNGAHIPDSISMQFTRLSTNLKYLI